MLLPLPPPIFLIYIIHICLLCVCQVNCVLMRGVNHDELVGFVELSKEVEVDIRFIEVMPFDDNKWNSKMLVTYTEAIEALTLAVITTHHHNINI